MTPSKSGFGQRQHKGGTSTHDGWTSRPNLLRSYPMCERLALVPPVLDANERGDHADNGNDGDQYHRQRRVAGLGGRGRRRRAGRGGRAAARCRAGSCGTAARRRGPGRRGGAAARGRAGRGGATRPLRVQREVGTGFHAGTVRVRGTGVVGLGVPPNELRLPRPTGSSPSSSRS